MKKLNKQSGLILFAFLIASTVHAWEFINNPDRFPSVGLHVDNQKLKGNREETVVNSAGQDVPYRHSDETAYQWRGGADVRLPATQSLTFTVSYDRVETDDWFTRHNTLGGDMYKEHKNLKGDNWGIGVRLYFNK